MYIEKTTAAERLTIRQAVDGSFVYVMRARRLLVQVLDEYFEDWEQKSISRSEAEDVRDILQAVNDALLCGGALQLQRPQNQIGRIVNCVCLF